MSSSTLQHPCLCYETYDGQFGDEHKRYRKQIGHGEWMIQQNKDQKSNSSFLLLDTDNLQMSPREDQNFNDDASDFPTRQPISS
jgi:hypothetical protein